MRSQFPSNIIDQAWVQKQEVVVNVFSSHVLKYQKNNDNDGLALSDPGWYSRKSHFHWAIV